MKHIITKLFLGVAVFLLSTVVLWAKPVNVDEAKNIAHQAFLIFHFKQIKIT
jgi:hypothetical protein